MKLIEYDRFQQIDDNTKNAIMEWWEPEPFDTMISTITGEVFQYSPTGKYNHKKIKEECIPLLTMQHLVDFIQWKSGERISICGGPVWVVEGEIHIGFQAKRYEDELLLGLLECAKQYCNREY